MKHCAKCGRSYSDETLNFCLEDGEWLTEVAAAEEPATAVMPESVSSPGKTTLERETQIYTSGDFVANELKGHKLRSAAIATAGLILLAGFGYGIYKFLGDRNKAPQRSNAAMTTMRLTGDGKVRDARISPDGKFLAYIRTDGGDRSIWIKQIQTNSAIQIAKPGELDDFESMVFSPDGNFLYFFAATKDDQPPSFYRVPTLGGTPTRAFTNVLSLRFSPDGKHVSFGRFDVATAESALYVANSDGTNERKIASRLGERWFDFDGCWSPDGKTIAVIEGDDSQMPNPNSFVTLISVDGGESTALGPKWATIDDVVWHPGADSVLVVASDSAIQQTQIWEIAYPSGVTRRLSSNLKGHRSLSITSDGVSIVTGELYAQTAVWVSNDTKPENAKQVMQATGDTWGLSWTPDSRIVFISDQTGDAEVWIMDADGGNSKPLTNDKVFKTTPVVSPDGQSIVYTSSLGGGQIFKIDINGGNSTLIAANASADNPDISPDGKWVIFSAYDGGVQRVLRVPIDGGNPQVLTDYWATEPRYSRDGTRFACFIVNEKTQEFSKLAIVPADGGPPIKIFDAPRNVNIGRGPVWTPDDKGITMIVAPGELQNIWVQPVEGGEAKAMTSFQLPGVSRREYSRDGKRIALVRGEGFGNAIMISNFR
jgi:TolB protein